MGISAGTWTWCPLRNLCVCVYRKKFASLVSEKSKRSKLKGDTEWKGLRDFQALLNVKQPFFAIDLSDSFHVYADMWMFSGDEVRMIDYMMWPWLQRLPLVRQFDPVFEASSSDLSELSAWSERMQALPAVQETDINQEIYATFFKQYLEGNPPYDLGLEPWNEQVFHNYHAECKWFIRSNFALIVLKIIVLRVQTLESQFKWRLTFPSLQIVSFWLLFRE